MTPEQFNEIRTRAEMATPGPWQVGGDDSIGLGIENDGFGGFAFDVILAEVTTQSDRNNDVACTPNRDSIELGTPKADAEFIAKAREDIPALIAEVEDLRNEQRMHMGVRTEVEKILDVALGPFEEDGAGAGLVGDIALLASKLDEARRGGKELGKVVEFLAELIKAAFVRGADDPTGALNMLGNHLAEILESEGGLSAAEFSRVQRALDARETKEELRLRDEAERRRAEVSRSLAEATPGGAR